MEVVSGHNSESVSTLVGLASYAPSPLCPSGADPLKRG